MQAEALAAAERALQLSMDASGRHAATTTSGGALGLSSSSSQHQQPYLQQQQQQQQQQQTFHHYHQHQQEDEHHQQLHQQQQAAANQQQLGFGISPHATTTTSPAEIGFPEQHLLEDLMRGVPQEESAAILQLLSRQQQDHQQGFLHDFPQAMHGLESMSRRPEKHFLTISQSGAILEATNTVTGFPPESLLMTSAYDEVYDEDLPGLHCIKTHCWDKGIPDVQVFLRRRTIEGDWVWLRSKAVAYVTKPVSGITLEETVVEDEAWAKQLNRIIRITAILVQAVEAAWLKEQKAEPVPNDEPPPVEPVPTLTEDAVAIQSMLDALSATGANIPDHEETMQNLAQLAAGSAKSSSNPEVNNELDHMDSRAAGRKKGFDPTSMIESVRQGVRLDLGLTQLLNEEVRLITLVLSGKLPVDQVVPVVRNALNTGMGLKRALRVFRLDSDKSSPRNLPSTNGSRTGGTTPTPTSAPSAPPPPISVLNLSYTYIGNTGIDMLSEILCCDGSFLKTLDVSFCAIEERGFIALAKALLRRKRKGIQSLKGLILSGNTISARAGSEIGLALSPAREPIPRKKRKISAHRNGYDESDSNDSSDDDEDDADFTFASRSKRNAAQRRKGGEKRTQGGRRGKDEKGLRLLHVANASLTAESLTRLLEGLGVNSEIKELNLASNFFGAAGAEALVNFFEKSRGQTTMPYLDRLDMSNNNLGDEGLTQLTRIISRRSETHIVDLKLSSNAIGSGGIETMMNKLLQHNLESLSLDKNAIGDQGCQLVAASLQSMKALSRMNLGFNQIGSRGITSLMRSLIACESITYLGLSGNMLRISGAISLAFTLAHHPRLEELDLDNCCLSQAAQCHIVAGIISNRWVPMKRLKGCAVGPPMVAIGALKPHASSLSNEECFRIRKEEQMKTIYQWKESNRIAMQTGRPIDPKLAAIAAGVDPQASQFLSPEFVDSMNDVQGAPSQDAYLRLLGWLSRIPFDDDELTALQKYFYDSDGGEGDRGSDGYVNLKLRGDLLAALDSEVADEIRDEFPSLASALNFSVAIDLDKLHNDRCTTSWKEFAGEVLPEDSIIVEKELQQKSDDDLRVSVPVKEKVNKVKPRITMFPKFEQQLDELKTAATEMIEQEDDPMQHEIILTQYAEASLTILRQLRYYCMNSGLDGWRKKDGGLQRKILVIDDSKVTRKLVSRAFENANFIVDTASNGAEGVEKLKASIYDIAFMDIDMPVMDGFEATKKLRDWEKWTRPGVRQPVCALTATYVDDFERSELMKFKEAGLDVMESKPCNIPRLLKVVDDVSPMFSDLSISVQRVRSDQEFHAT